LYGQLRRAEKHRNEQENRERARQNQAIKAARRRSFERCFVDAAHQLLSPDQVQAITDLARKQSEAEEA
jgi:hypothetical protein